MIDEKLIIAIDGHSSCGKSTFAKAIAERMNYVHIDSGAMYRAATLACMEHGILKKGRLDEDALPMLLDNMEITFKKRKGSDETDTFLNGVNVEERIRRIDVASNVSNISQSPKIRGKMVAMQQQMGRNKGIVMDGRDIGTVVFPDADIKIFMTAEAGIRAQRRFKELADKDHKVSLEDIRTNIINRDKMDETRLESPLRKPKDAVILDNSYMTPKQQMKWFDDLLLKMNLK